MLGCCLAASFVPFGIEVRTVAGEDLGHAANCLRKFVAGFVHVSAMGAPQSSHECQASRQMRIASKSWFGVPLVTSSLRSSRHGLRSSCLSKRPVKLCGYQSMFQPKQVLLDGFDGRKFPLRAGAACVVLRGLLAKPEGFLK
jgi:hypothetical protein